MRDAIRDILTLALLAVLLGAGCGSGDRPSDCTNDEFFNDQTNRCTPCPAISPPECTPGCGWEVTTAENGCRIAQCSPDCDVCPVGEQFSEEKAVCEPCPGAPDCSQFGCEGSIRVEGSFRAPCPPASAFACGMCQNPEDGCVADDAGMCIDQ